MDFLPEYYEMCVRCGHFTLRHMGVIFGSVFYCDYCWIRRSKKGYRPKKDLRPAVVQECPFCGWRWHYHGWGKYPKCPHCHREPRHDTPDKVRKVCPICNKVCFVQLRQIEDVFTGKPLGEVYRVYKCIYCKRVYDVAGNDITKRSSVNMQMKEATRDVN